MNYYMLMYSQKELSVCCWAFLGLLELQQLVTPQEVETYNFSKRHYLFLQKEFDVKKRKILEAMGNKGNSKINLNKKVFTYKLKSSAHFKTKEVL